MTKYCSLKYNYDMRTKKKATKSNILLHKLLHLPENDHVSFTFVVSDLNLLCFNSEYVGNTFEHGGHYWTLIVKRTTADHVGFYLKWVYNDFSSKNDLLVEIKFHIILENRLSDADSCHLMSTQTFSTEKTIVGRSRLVENEKLFDPSNGYFDLEYRHCIVTINMGKVKTYFRTDLDTQQEYYTKKNDSGYYFESNEFSLSQHRWKLRYYPHHKRSNSPSIYLYNASYNQSDFFGTRLIFDIFINEWKSGVLNYTFRITGGSKKLCYGKSLETESLTNFTRKIRVGISILSISIISFPKFSIISKSIILPKDDTLNSSTVSSANRSTFSINCTTEGYIRSSYNQSNKSIKKNLIGGINHFKSSYTVDPFDKKNDKHSNAFIQDPNGNAWSIFVSKNATFSIIMKHEYIQKNLPTSSSVLIASFALLANDGDHVDVSMSDEPVVLYTDSQYENNYPFLISFPITLAEVEKSGYIDKENNISVSFEIISQQRMQIQIFKQNGIFDFMNKQLSRLKEEVLNSKDRMNTMKDLNSSYLSICPDQSINSEFSPDRSFIHSPTPNDTSFISLSFNSLQEKNRETMPTQFKLSPVIFLATFLDSLETAFNSKALKKQKCTQPVISRNLIIQKSDVAESPLLNSTDSALACESDCSKINESDVSIYSNPHSLENLSNYKFDFEYSLNIVNIIKDILITCVPIFFNDIIEFGSHGLDLYSQDYFDADLILLSNDFPMDITTFDWINPIVTTIKNLVLYVLKQHHKSVNIINDNEKSTWIQINFKRNVNIDILFSHNWNCYDDKYEKYYNLCKEHYQEHTIIQRLSPGIVTLQKKFLLNIDEDVKTAIKYVKNWRNKINWIKTNYRPNSYLICLLVVRAYELCANEHKSHIYRIIQKFCELVLKIELRIEWDTNYNLDKYKNIEFEPPTPLVRDPANPFYNVANNLIYWGKFRSEAVILIKSLSLRKDAIQM